MSDKKLENNGKQTTKKIAYKKPQLNKKSLEEISRAFAVKSGMGSC